MSKIRQDNPENMIQEEAEIKSSKKKSKKSNIIDEIKSEKSVKKLGLMTTPDYLVYPYVGRADVLMMMISMGLPCTELIYSYSENEAHNIDVVIRLGDFGVGEKVGFKSAGDFSEYSRTLRSFDNLCHLVLGVEEDSYGWHCQLNIDDIVYSDRRVVIGKTYKLKEASASINSFLKNLTSINGSWSSDLRLMRTLRNRGQKLKEVAGVDKDYAVENNRVLYGFTDVVKTLDGFSCMPLTDVVCVSSVFDEIYKRFCLEKVEHFDIHKKHSHDYVMTVAESMAVDYINKHIVSEMKYDFQWGKFRVGMDDFKDVAGYHYLKSEKDIQKWDSYDDGRFVMGYIEKDKHYHFVLEKDKQEKMLSWLKGDIAKIAYKAIHSRLNKIDMGIRGGLTGIMNGTGQSYLQNMSDNNALLYRNQARKLNAINDIRHTHKEKQIEKMMANDFIMTYFVYKTANYHDDVKVKLNTKYRQLIKNLNLTTLCYEKDENNEYIRDEKGKAILFEKPLSPISFKQYIDEISLSLGLKDNEREQQLREGKKLYVQYVKEKALLKKFEELFEDNFDVKHFSDEMERQKFLVRLYEVQSKYEKYVDAVKKYYTLESEIDRENIVSTNKQKIEQIKRHRAFDFRFNRVVSSLKDVELFSKKEKELKKTLRSLKEIKSPIPVYQEHMMKNEEIGERILKVMEFFVNHKYQRAGKEKERISRFCFTYLNNQFMSKEEACNFYNQIILNEKYRKPQKFIKEWFCEFDYMGIDFQNENTRQFLLTYFHEMMMRKLNRKETKYLWNKDKQQKFENSLANYLKLYNEAQLEVNNEGLSVFLNNVKKHKSEKKWKKNCSLLTKTIIDVIKHMMKVSFFKDVGNLQTVINNSNTKLIGKDGNIIPAYNYEMLMTQYRMAMVKRMENTQKHNKKVQKQKLNKMNISTIFFNEYLQENHIDLENNTMIENLTEHFEQQFKTQQKEYYTNIRDNLYPQYYICQDDINIFD